MTAVDAGILAILVLSTLIAAWRGLVRSLFSLFGWLAATIATLMFGATVAIWMPSSWSDPARLAVGYVLVFASILLTASLVGWTVARLLRAVGLGGVDRVLGALFGAARGALIVGVGVIALSWTPFAQASAWRSSVLVPWIDLAVQSLLPREDRVPVMKV